MKNILFIKGQSQYNALRNYIDEIATAFQLVGYNTCIIDAEESSFNYKLYQIKKNIDINIVFTCNSIAISEKKIRDLFPTADYITYLCDHPAKHANRLQGLSERCFVFTCDKRHKDYIIKNYPNIKHVEFVPLSGSYVKEHIPYTERKLDIVFTGSYINPQKIYEEIIQSFNGSLLTFAKYMITLIIAEPSLDIEMCLNRALQYFGIEVSEKEFQDLIVEFMGIDRYARFYYRDRMIRTLLRSGLIVHVFGCGWEKFQGEEKRNLRIENGNSYVALKAVANAKISLNVMPWFKAGFQERIATAMLSGTVSVTDNSEYIAKEFKDNEELVIYELDHLEDLPEKLKLILRNSDLAEKIAQNGEIRAKSSLLWQHRVNKMLEYIETKISLQNEEAKEYGQIINIPYDSLHERSIGIEAIHNMQEILSMIEEVKQYSSIQKSDIRYFYDRFLKEFMKLKANYPEITISENIYDYLTNITDQMVEFGIELLERECSHILSKVLSVEYSYQEKEKQQLRYQIQQTNIRPNAHSQKILIERMNKKYGKSEESTIQEILANINKSGWVEAYNQNFVYNHNGSSEELTSQVGYDADVDMCYAIWNGKRMYYPKGYSVQDVITAVNFVKLEQDVDSPHRYLDEYFNVQEDSIVIDAGVAEGNFALDIVEHAKKIYLVECEHKWVEALQKTFEPWKEKVVIIEKMLGKETDESHASIDDFVEEGYVNFIKMDVEGAEVDSLIGADKVLENSKDVKCAICAYHRKNAEKDIRTLLENHHFYTSTTKGYMFFKEDLDSWLDAELRHGLVRAEKRQY